MSGNHEAVPDLGLLSPQNCEKQMLAVYVIQSTVFLLEHTTLR